MRPVTDMTKQEDAPRGFSLVAVLIVVVVATLLVVGALTFTGSERSAAMLETRSQQMSACAQAARNMFVSQIRVLQGNVGAISFDAGIGPVDGGVRLSTGHYDGSVNLISIQKVDDSNVGQSSKNVYNLSNRVGAPALLAGYYTVTAVCRDVASSKQQEIEFMVRVGL